ncbi:MAG TPA: ABC transporter ATP-binding protein [Candidatus Methylomirabilis sp.]|nr:ABC transporter ATP-binding protein [Candidatus Methylomirabilis sp.]
MAEVRLENLAAVFGTHRVFEHFNLTIRDGECFTLLGPSGCGKTVIMRMIAGFEHPSQGEVFIGDRLVSSAAKKVHVPTESRHIGVVFQDYAVWPHKTVFDNVVYPLQIQKVPTAEARERTLEAIKQVHLGSLEERYPSQLSGGQQQRVALARALVSRPQIMLLDEPLTNLDANLREEMRFEIKDLQRRTGVTILYVTHDQEVALAISDRMGVMGKDGSLRQMGTPHEIYTNPDDGFVFNFLGVANFIPVERRNGAVHIQGSDVPLSVEIPQTARERVAKGEVVAACRPFEIDLTREGGATRGLVRRRVFLGSIVTYFVTVGQVELRAQQEAAEAFRDGRALEEGEACGLTFQALRWFDKTSAGQEA